MPDFYKTLRKDMELKTEAKFCSPKGQDFFLVIVFVIFPFNESKGCIERINMVLFT
jgi:hypothetical protein